MTFEQALVNLLVHSQCLLEAMDVLEQEKKFTLRHMLKFHAKGFKEQAEKLVEEFWKKVPDCDKHYFEDMVTAKIKLIEAYDNGEIIIEN